MPTDYGIVHAFAQACGASRDELRTLHRLWALADANRVPAPGAETGQDAAAHAVPTESTPTGPAPAADDATPARPQSLAAAPEVSGSQPDEPTGRPSRWRRARVVGVAAGVSALLLGAAAWKANHGDAPLGSDKRTLFTPACTSTIAMGQHDNCVLEVQQLLKAKGATIGIDGDFGPETQRRVTAFQLFAGLPPKGVVDEPTKKALYEREVSMKPAPRRR